jgi:aminoglycoside phosphotransferase (APT) family kinase protein
LPSHRSFRPAQVLLHKGEIGFIDFDGFCQAEPALDLALFMVKIKHIALTKPGEDEEVALMDETTRLARLAQMETICERFLSEYEKYAPVSRPRIMLWEALDVLSLVLGCWTKIKTWRLDNTIFMLERLLQANGLASGL